MMEKWEDRKSFSFPYLYLDEKPFCFVENKFCINLPSCPYYIRQKVTHYTLKKNYVQMDTSLK